MKKIRLFIALVISMIAFGLSAQELPQAINFQAIARDTNGQALSNANIMLQLTVIDGTPEGPEVYREIRSLQTNAYGGFNFQLGREPDMANGVFADIDWANGRKFLKVDYDPTGTMSFDLSLGTIEFISVPYAFVAGEVSYIDATNANDGDVLVFNAATGHFEPQAISTGGITEETDPTVPDWAKEPQKPTYDYSEILNTPEIPEVPENVSAFNNDAGYITSADVPSIPENVSAFNNDAGYITSADIPEIPEVPTNVSAFVNDANYITSADVPTNVSAFENDANYITAADIPAIPEIPENVSAFNNDAGYITSADVPAIPENVSAFNNDAGYITSADIPDIPEVPTNVSAFVNDANYITAADIPENVSAFNNDAGYITSADVPAIPENVSAFNNDAGYLTSYVEVQALSMSGDTVFLTGGSYVVLPEEMQTLSDVVANGNLANAQLKNVTDPTEAQDAVTMAFLDAKIAEINDKIAQLEGMLNMPNDSIVPEGGLDALFTVSETGKKVRFSKGNLQYQASTSTWRFAENQWNCIGSSNSNISPSYSGWIDLFGWGTGSCPTKTSTDSYDYSIFFTDWGINPISNGGNTAKQWRTLSHDEWKYLLFTRTTASGIRYAKAKVNGVAGVIILPDNWSTLYFSLGSTNDASVDFSVNIITLVNWTSKFEAHGAVFLPTAGSRNGTSVGGVGTYGLYWSSDLYHIHYGFRLLFNTSVLNLNRDDTQKMLGSSVRLVKDAN